MDFFLFFLIIIKSSSGNKNSVITSKQIDIADPEAGKKAKQIDHFLNHKQFWNYIIG